MVCMLHGQYHSEEKSYPVLLPILMGSGGQRSALGPCNSGEVTLLNRGLGLVLV